MVLTVLEDETVVHEDGRTILYSVPRFLAEVKRGNGCFICGAEPGTKEFNDEHVIPNWVLRDRELHSRRIVLPNSAEFMYGRLVVPCCIECNERMAVLFEEPISAAFGRGYEGVANLMRSGDGGLLWLWMALIFFKLHLKHRELRWYLDQREGGGKMSDTYDWVRLHHLHCVVRSFHTGAIIDPQVYGSLLVWPANTDEPGDDFDFADLLPEASMLIRIGSVFVFAVMNDSGFAVSSMQDLMQRITGPLTRIQGREVLAKICHRNISIEPPPVYQSWVNVITGAYRITAELSDDTHLIEDGRPELYGGMMAFFLEDLLAKRHVDPKVMEYIRTGYYSFVFGEEGRFISYGDDGDLLVGPKHYESR